MHKHNKGFTLVELIVVLVILAILAAILIPALLGYIDRAKEGQDMLNAKNMLTATQAELTDYYARGDDPRDGRKNDYDVNTTFAKKVRETADDDPYLVIIGVGVGDDEDKRKAEHEKYTAYFVAYWETKEKEPLFFNGQEWSMDYPWADGESGSNYNYFTVNGERKHLTFIFVANKTGQSNPWNYLQNTIKTNKRNRAPKGTTKK
ncbi:MAG: prepilin-type N-terminal cleavage/methylation domain-containing protein [Eubacteriales bacterium]|nr:prepilin-type N-terminal cleavage/methylation domain-containing protein [Eubacteriales bacterium]